MPHVEFNYREDFEHIVKQGLSSAQFQLLKELFQNHNVDQDQLYYIMHKKPEAIKFKKGDHVLYVGYTHLRPSQTEFVVNEVIKIHIDCLTDVTIKPLSGGHTQRVYHRDLIKIDK
tara:strand:- start:243 stop:590 length:348 start_codon:yes stop_codon:yes gene_type:complete